MKKTLALVMPLLLFASVSLLMVARAYAGEPGKLIWPPADWSKVFDPGNPVDRNGNGWIWQKTLTVDDKTITLEIDDIPIEDHIPI